MYHFAYCQFGKVIIPSEENILLHLCVFDLSPIHDGSHFGRNVYAWVEMVDQRKTEIQSSWFRSNTTVRIQTISISLSFACIYFHKLGHLFSELRRFRSILFFHFFFPDFGIPSKSNSSHDDTSTLRLCPTHYVCFFLSAIAVIAFISPLIRLIVCPHPSGFCTPGRGGDSSNRNIMKLCGWIGTNIGAGTIHPKPEEKRDRRPFRFIFITSPTKRKVRVAALDGGIMRFTFLILPTFPVCCLSLILEPGSRWSVEIDKLISSVYSFVHY